MNTFLARWKSVVEERTAEEKKKYTPISIEIGVICLIAGAIFVIMLFAVYILTG